MWNVGQHSLSPMAQWKISMKMIELQPVDLACFDKLETNKDYRNDFNWLSQLNGIESIANFGCWSPEPLALLWMLNAREVKVIEKEERYLTRPKEILEKIKVSFPGCLDGRFVEFLPPSDMITVELPIDYFDLAYCERVLTNMDNDHTIQAAIEKMAGVVKPGGWVIAVESMPDEQGNPRSRNEIESMFIKAGLKEEKLDGSPENAFCYRKLPKTEKDEK
jgi:SAM-dependent methyltransferase